VSDHGGGEFTPSPNSFSEIRTIPHIFVLPFLKEKEKWLILKSFIFVKLPFLKQKR